MTQPEALRLADLLEMGSIWQDQEKAAAELRRLHEENEALREAAEQALEALELNNSEWKSLADSGDAGYWHAEDQDYYKQTSEAIAALRAALAEQKCPCGDRPADQCPGEWEPGCDLGANEKYAKVAEQAQPIYWEVSCAANPTWMRVNEEQFIEYVSYGWKGRKLYTTKPAPQSLRDLCAAAYQVVGVAGGPVEMLDNLVAAADGKPLPHDPGAGLPWSPPSPQPLSGLDVERLLEDVVGSLPVARKLIRAVEAEVRKRVGVQR